MPCRVGVTTIPSHRRGTWEKRVIGLRNWKQSPAGSKAEALQEAESKKNGCMGSHKRGTCHGHPGGGDPDNGKWYVYEFDYVRERK